MDVENVLGSGYGDVLGGDSGTNRLSGGGGDDRLSGRGGDDVLEGGAGADRLDGGLGADTVSYSRSDEAVTVDLEAGTVAGGHAADDVIVDVENVLGSGYGDVLGGDSGANRLDGGDGDDMLDGRAGADRLDGGLGVDTVSYSGSDKAVIVYLWEGAGKRGQAEGDVIVDIENVLGSGYGDVLGGDDGANRLSGGGGNDRLSGRGGDDVLEGGAGADRLLGGAGDDTVSYAGSDRGVIVYLWNGTGKRGHAEGDVIAQVESVLGSGYGDVLGGDDGANRLSGGGGNDRLSGRGGDDVLEGGAGADRLNGGAGVDTVSYARSELGVAVDLGEGTVAGGHAEGDVIVDFENVVGSEYGDVLRGDGGGNQLDGGDGDDILDGGIGADRLDGGLGVDTVSYGGSDEAVTVDLEAGAGEGGHAEGDVIVDVENVVGSGYGDVLGGDAGANRLDGGAGMDTVSYSGSDEAVTVDLEASTVAGGHAEGDVIVDFENVVGSEYGDVLRGDGGGNRLDGGDGDDMLDGRAGADRLDGGLGVDTVSYSGSDEAVTVDLEAGTVAGGHAEGDVIVDVENVVGSGYGDKLEGDDGANRLDGGDDDDYLLGNDGDDSLWGGAGYDLLVGGAGDDSLWGGAGNDYDLSGGAGDDQLWGGAGGDNLQGGAGDDRLSGDDGDDWLSGDAGNDRLSGGAGDDIFGFDFGHGDDIITDFTDGDDLIDLSGFNALSGFDELVVSSDPDGVTIDLTAHLGGTIRLEGFDIADLDAGDFQFWL